MRAVLAVLMNLLASVWHAVTSAMRDMNCMNSILSGKLVVLFFTLFSV